MSEKPELHARLIARQSTEELRRKRDKAWTPYYWTQEDIDYAERAGQEFAARIRWNEPTS